MMTLPCPACGAAIPFQARTSVLAVCPFCRVTVVRNEAEVTRLSQMTEMPLDMSPLQLETQGQYQKAKFKIVGRQRVGWKDGSWNEWYLLFSTGKTGWLSDAQGQYMVSFEREGLDLPSADSLEVGTKIQIAGTSFTVQDSRRVRTIAIEGELPFAAEAGLESLSVDLVSEDSQFANLLQQPSGTFLYTGRYLDVEELHLSHLRTIDGWS